MRTKCNTNTQSEPPYTPPSTVPSPRPFLFPLWPTIPLFNAAFKYENIGVTIDDSLVFLEITRREATEGIIKYRYQSLARIYYLDKYNQYIIGKTRSGATIIFQYLKNAYSFLKSVF